MHANPAHSPSRKGPDTGIPRRAILKLVGAGSALAVLAAGAQAVVAAPAMAAEDAVPPRGPSTTSNVNSSDVLDVFGGQTSDGAEIIQWPGNDAKNQKWIFTVLEDGWVSIASYNSGRLLDLANSSTADGTRVEQWGATGALTQQWRLEAAGESRVTIRNRASGTLLSVESDSDADGAQIVIRADTGHASQRWTLQGPPGSEIPYTLDTSATEQRTDEPIPNMGGLAGGVLYGATRNGWSRDGKPWYPVSGEFHYLRYPEHAWEREIGKMRSAGVTIVATYVFWENHEVTEGSWDWSGRKNLRAFVEAVQRQGMQLWLRPGPFINAEAPNGGIPVFAQSGSRSNDAGYLAKVDRYFAQLSAHLSGLWVKDGGPIVGIQIENEFAHGEPAHITRLQEMCVAHGMVAPFYTVTANSHFDAGKVMPLQGSYSYRGWQTAGGDYPVSGYVYGSDEWTANTDIGGSFYNTLDYPRGYCELGTGSPMRGNDRFLVEAKYVVSQAYDSVGRGCNYLGYYMFHGGTQLTTGGGSWPQTYDFQAPLGEFGQTRECYAQYRRLHTFLNTSAEELVPTRFSRDPGQILDPENAWRQRFIGRFDAQGRGFIFVNNTQRNVAMTLQTGLQIKVTTPTETVAVPSTPMTMPVGKYAFFPFMTDLNGATLRWATVEPLAKLQGDDMPTWVYWVPKWTNQTLAFPKATVVDDELGTTERSVAGEELLIKVSKDQRTSLIVRGANGAPVARLILLTDQESLNASVARIDGRERLIVASGGQLTGTTPTVRFAGAAGGSLSVELYPKNGLAASSQWTSFTAQGPFAGRRRALPAATAAPTVTSQGNGRWKIAIDEQSLADIAEAHLVLDYKGGRAELIGADTTITNDLYHGEKWTIDLKLLSAAARSDLVVKVDAWDNAIVGVQQPDGTLPALPSWEFKPLCEVEWTATELEPQLSTRIVGGKVYLNVAVRNIGQSPLDIDVATLYGAKTFTAVQPGKSATAAFNSRLVAIPAGSATVSGKRGGVSVYSATIAYGVATSN